MILTLKKNLRDASKAMLKGKFIALNAKERWKISIHLKKLTKGKIALNLKKVNGMK